ncbi:hypothetical protein DICA3_D13498 [Diutina catenulata]
MPIERAAVAPLVTVVYTAFAAIAIVVFLTSTQPFYLKYNVKIPSPKTGQVIGNLGTADELVAMAAAPLVGSIIDTGRKPHRVIMGGFGLVSVALIGYAKWSHPLMLVFLHRAVFALGVTSAMTMVTVVLNDIVTVTESDPGKLSSVVGIASGCGAIFAVSAFTTLPVRLGHWFDIGEQSAISAAYAILAGFSVISLVCVALVGRNYRQNDSRDSQASSQDPTRYWKRIMLGYEAAKDDRRAQLALIGGFVARSSSVANAVFIPMVVYKWFSDQGECKLPEGGGLLDRFSCAQGFKFAAILTGVSQTVALISAPVWGIAVDRYSSRLASGVCATIGIIASVGFSTVSNPKSVMAFVWVSFLGVAQLGAIISSMSTISALRSPSQPVIGTISGFYSLCGSVGILTISLIGGWLSDVVTTAPFMVLAVFYLVFLVGSYFLKASTLSYLVATEVI